MLRHNQIIPEVMQLLHAKSFWWDAHQKIFEAIIGLYEQGSPVDLVLLAEELHKRNEIEDIGGYVFLTNVWEAGFFQNCRHYAKIVQEKHAQRSLMQVSQRIFEDMINPTGPIEEMLYEAQRQVEAVHLELNPAPTVTPEFGFKWDAMSSDAFAQTQYPLRWLVQRLLVEGQPGVVGGPKKGLKTNIVIDLVLSLGTGTKFLEHFQTYNPVRCALLSGESGQATIQETAQRICRAKEIELAGANVFWGFRLPQLGNDGDLTALYHGLKENEIKVVVIDPLYLCCLSSHDQERKQASNMFQMGPLFLRVAQACLLAGCTPLLIHHGKQGMSTTFESMELGDLAFAGIQEFTRQWILINRREKFEMGEDGANHKLWLSAGGSVGHGGLWAVDIQEGVLSNEFTGRIWDVIVKKPGDAFQDEADAREEEKQQKQHEKDQKDGTRLLMALDDIDPQRNGASCNAVQTHARMGKTTWDRSISRLLRQEIIEVLPVNSEFGCGAKRTVSGIRRRPLRTNGHLPDGFL
jgi:replicative DNA helicase